MTHVSILDDGGQCFPITWPQWVAQWLVSLVAQSFVMSLHVQIADIDGDVHALSCDHPRQSLLQKIGMADRTSKPH